mgnify:CR=1 FL=1
MYIIVITHTSNTDDNFLKYTAATNRKKLRIIVSEITKELLNVFKGNNRDFEVLTKADWDPGEISGDLTIGALLGPYVWPVKISPDDDYPEDTENPDPFSVSFSVTVNTQSLHINVAGSNIPADDLFDGIDIRVQLPHYPKDLVSSEMRLIAKEVMNTVSHELEHMSQEGSYKSYERGEKYYSDLPDETEVSGSSTFKYLMKPSEVVAHVIGYSSHSQTYQELENEIRQFAKAYCLSGQISHKEANQVIDTWLHWARKNLKQKRFKA